MTEKKGWPLPPKWVLWCSFVLFVLLGIYYMITNFELIFTLTMAVEYVGFFVGTFIISTLAIYIPLALLWNHLTTK